MANADESWVREVIHTVEAMTQQLTAYRQDVTRALSPMYPRIVEIEKRLDQEAKERPQRQKDLDRKLESQNAVASQQGAKIEQAVSTLKAHGEILREQSNILGTIYRWQAWGRAFDLILLAAILIAALVWWL